MKLSFKSEEVISLKKLFLILILCTVTLLPTVSSSGPKEEVTAHAEQIDQEDAILLCDSPLDEPENQ